MGRREMPSNLPAELAEVLYDNASSIDTRTESLMRHRAKIEIVDTILYRKAWHDWNFQAILDCAINDGKTEEIAMAIKEACKLRNEKDEAVYDLQDFCEKLIGEYVSDEMIDTELADEEYSE